MLEASLHGNYPSDTTEPILVALAGNVRWAKELIKMVARGCRISITPESTEAPSRTRAHVDSLVKTTLSANQLSRDVSTEPSLGRPSSCQRPVVSSMGLTDGSFYWTFTTSSLLRLSPFTQICRSLQRLCHQPLV